MSEQATAGAPAEGTSGDAAPVPDTPVQSPTEKVEMDTAADEDEVNLNELLLPGGIMPTDLRSFSVAYNNSVFKGWVKQHSPVCAASSIAGAWNSVLHLGRDGAASKSQDCLLDVLRGIVGEQARRASETLCRTLLVKDLNDLLAAVEEDVEATGRSMGGRKEKGVRPKECIAMLRERCVAAVLAAPETEANAAEATEKGMPENAFESLVDAWNLTRARAAELRAEAEAAAAAAAAAEAAKAAEGEDGAAEAEAAAAPSVEGAEAKAEAEAGAAAEKTKTKKAAAATAEDEELLGSDEEDEDDDEALVAALAAGTDGGVGGKPGKKKKAGAKKKPGAKASAAASAKTKTLSQMVHEGLSKWLRAVIALAKLNRQPSPSTAGIGNWGVAQGIQALCDQTGESVSVKGLLGRGCGVLSKTKDTDGPETVAKQWSALRDAFTAPHSAVLFHQTNHYSLVFALRSWTDCDGKEVREILTARKGQRPHTGGWMSFEEVRTILNGWVGYKMFRIRRVPEKAGGAGAGAGAGGEAGGEGEEGSEASPAVASGEAEGEVEAEAEAEASVAASDSNVEA